MPRQLKIGDHIEFVADAQHRSNVEGNFQPTKPVLFDDFLHPVIDATNDWTVTVGGTDDAIAYQANAGGAARITTGKTDNDTSSIASALVWLGSKNPVAEAKIKIADASGTALFFGFTDANTESLNSMPLDFGGTDGAFQSVATDAVGFVIDADHAESEHDQVIALCGTANNSDATNVDTDIEWADNAEHVLRVELKDIGTNCLADFYVDGVFVGQVADKASRDNVPLCVAIFAATRAGDGQNTVDVDYIYATQDR